MTRSADFDKVLSELVKANVLVFRRHGKRHRQYEVALPFAVDPKKRLVIHSFSGSKGGGNIHAQKNYLAELRRLLKPGVMEKVMGWDYKEPLAESISKAADQGGKGTTIGEQLAAKMKSIEKVSDNVVTVPKPATVEPAQPSVKLEEPKPQIEPEKPSAISSGLEVPEKVVLDDRNRPLGLIVNNYIDRQYVLVREILEREEAIKQLTVNLDRDKQEFKQNSEFIEQMELAIIALPKTPIPPKVEIQVSSTSPQAQFNRPNTFTSQDLVKKLNQIFEGDKNHAFSKEELAKGLASYTKDSLEVSKNRITYLLSQGAKLSGVLVKWERFGRGLYTYKG